MKITEDVRKYAAEQGIAEEEALKRGMEEKSRKFTEKGVSFTRRREPSCYANGHVTGIHANPRYQCRYRKDRLCV